MQYAESPERPPRLTKSQKRQLCEVLVTGLEEAGFATVCWTAVLVQQWIEQVVDVLYNLHYVCELLHNVVISYQKAYFVADHLDVEARQR